MCDTLPKNYSSLKKGKKSCIQLGTLPKQTIVRHFQAMFHTPISCLKYLSAKYSILFFNSHRGAKTRDIRGHQGPPAS
ncbi:hypothetical protein AB205_0134570 [Aquarana catesbeiana]|uniref:Uncharacterized protein n=1 Tax=Aquarana catesbeiana TaxID=8400 RepID=A0A2G9P850_AQUCT|nr:hypothetical protein AB205_0134570 [Aquarana catesbeiana]